MTRDPAGPVYRIGVQADTTRIGGKFMSFSERWIELAHAGGHEVRQVDVYQPDALEQIAGCDGFMWRFHGGSAQRLCAKRLIPAIASVLGIPVYPDATTVWYYNDKIAMHYLLWAARIATPETQVFWTRETALDYCRGAAYPLVLKLATGSASSNVQLVRSAAEAAARIDALFGSGLFTFARTRIARPGAVRRILQALRWLIRDRLPEPPLFSFELQKNYLLVQEFVPDNPFDTRITVIGNRAYGFRRFNRPGDFRASGGGRFDHDSAAIGADTIRLAFRTAHALRLPTVAVDVLRRGSEPVVIEINYDYVNWVVNECPGHWVLHGDPDSGVLEWRDGRTRSEDAIFADFVASLDARSGREFQRAS